MKHRPSSVERSERRLSRKDPDRLDDDSVSTVEVESIPAVYTKPPKLFLDDYLQTMHKLSKKAAESSEKVVAKFLKEEKKKSFFKTKARQPHPEKRPKEIESEEESMKAILLEITQCSKAVQQSIVQLYFSMAQYWQTSYEFRYRVLDAKTNFVYEKMKRVIQRQEKNLLKMEEEYGKRTAARLRGAMINKRKQDFLRWEKENNEFKLQKNIEIEQSEERMFVNSFIYSKKFLSCKQTVSLTHLVEIQADKLPKMRAYDNMGFKSWYHYQINFEEIAETILAQVAESIQKIEPFLDKRFQKSCADLLKGMLDSTLKMLRCRVNPKDLLAMLPSTSPKIAKIMKDKVSLLTETVDAFLVQTVAYKLTDLKLAFMYSQYFRLIENLEKSYFLLNKAFRESRPAVEKYIQLFAEYRRFYPSMSAYLRDKGQVEPNESMLTRHPMHDFRNFIFESSTRTPFVIIVLEQFEKTLSVAELIDILESLGDAALNMCYFTECISFFKMLVLVCQIYYQFKILLDDEESQSEDPRNQRLTKLLNLNKKMILVHRKLAVACFKSNDYFMCFQFLVCCIFIYNNSLKLVDQNDPLKYPKKNPNDFLKISEMENVVKAKTGFQIYLQFFNDAYRQTLDCYQQLWKHVEENPRKFRQEFFQMVKNCLERIESISNYSKRTFVNYLSEGQVLPNIGLDRGLLKSYQLNYIGNIDTTDIDDFLDLKVQLLVKQKPSLKAVYQLKPGKLNKTKVCLIFEFNSMNIDLMQEIFQKAFYFSEKRFIGPAEDLEKSVPLVYRVPHPIKPYRDKWRQLLSEWKEAVALANGHPELRAAPSLQSIVYFDRIYLNLVPEQIKKFASLLYSCKLRFNFIKAIKSKKKDQPKERDLSLKERTKLMVARSNANPDLKIGIPLRRRGTLSPEKTEPKPSRFFREKKKQVDWVNLRLQLAEYVEKRKSGLRRRLSLRPARVQPAVLPTDLLNICSIKADFYEQARVSRVRNSKETKRLNTNPRYHSQAYDNSDEDDAMIMQDIEKNKAAQPDDIVPDIELSLVDLCRNSFHFLVSNQNLYETFDIRFDISQESIKFLFFFKRRDSKVSKTVFEMKLKQELWMLKEKFTLTVNSDLVKTYNPIIFDILLKSFFSETFEMLGKTQSVTPQDVDLLNSLKRFMGLKFPIPITRLKSYDLDYLESCKLFQEFTKFDVDHLQALLSILCYLAKIIRGLFLKTPVGDNPLRYFDLSDLIANHKQELPFLNSIFLINHKVDQMRKNLKTKLDRIFFDEALFTRRRMIQLTDINIDNIQMMIENLYVKNEFVRRLAGPTKTFVRMDRKKSSFDVFVSRQTFKDDHEAIHFFDMSVKVINPRLKVNLDHLKGYHENLVKLLSISQVSLSRQQCLLFLFFLLLENSVVFFFRVDSLFRQKWLRIFKDKKPIVIDPTSHSSRDAERWRRLILEMPNPKILKPDQAFISLSEMYYMIRSYQTGAKHFREFDLTSNLILSDLNFNYPMIFDFLTSVCANPYDNPYYVYFHRKFLQTCLKENYSIFTVSKSFYQVTSIKKAVTIQQINFYYFKYPMVRKFLRGLNDGMKKQLERLIGVINLTDNFSMKFFKTFTDCYKLLSERDEEDSKIADEKESFYAMLTEKRGLLEIQTAENTKQSAAPESQEKPSTDKKNNLFDEVFFDIVRKFPKKNDVVSAHQEQRSAPSHHDRLVPESSRGGENHLLELRPIRHRRHLARKADGLEDHRQLGRQASDGRRNTARRATSSSCSPTTQRK